MQFPEIITRMPQAKLPVSGLKAHVMRSEHGLVAFFEATDDTTIPPHAHKAQWGTVLEGEVELPSTAKPASVVREIPTTSNLA